MKLKSMTTKLTAVLLFTIFASAHAQSLSHAEILEIKAEINILVNDYAFYRDNHDAVKYANLFAEDGKLIIDGSPTEGRAAIQKRVEDSNPELVYMHMMTTGHIDVIDANNATGTQYAAVFRVLPEESAEKGAPVPVSGFASQGKYIDKYVNTDEGWRLAERSFSRVYAPAQ